MNNNNNSNNNQMEWKKIRQLFKVIIFINGSMNMRNHFLLLATREKWKKRNKHKRKTNHEDVRLTHIPSKCGGTTTKFDNLIHKNNFQIDNFQCFFFLKRFLFAAPSTKNVCRQWYRRLCVMLFHINTLATQENDLKLFLLKMH